MSSLQSQLVNNTCPRCGAPLVVTEAISGAPSEFWLECTRCNAYVNTYRPQPHQEAVHRDPHLYVGNFGGYGTGKTLTSRQEIYKHCFLTPNANVLVCANIAAQYEQTIKRDIENDLPKRFLKNMSVQKSYIDLINNARIMFRPLDDVDKLRSLNLSMFVIVEASETDPEAFHQLKTRLRNMHASVPKLDADGNIMTTRLPNGAEVPLIEADWRRGIVESNPDSGWIRNDVLYASQEIHTHGEILEHINVPNDRKDKYISTHVASTSVNNYLPSNFIEELCKNKPNWWINRYIFSSFSYAEGLVYPGAPSCIIESFDVPTHWKRIIAADYGLHDDFVYLYGALDCDEGCLHIYKERRTNNRNIEELANIYHEEAADIPAGGLYTPPILDPKSGAKRDYNKKTLYDHFLDYGIAFQPGHVSVDARVFRLNTYIESGKLKIHDCCTGLIEELNNYKFPPRRLGVSNRAQDKPVDKNNHGINPLEWICMALPADPKKLMLGAYDGHGRDITKEIELQRQAGIPWALKDDNVEHTDMFEREVW